MLFRTLSKAKVRAVYLGATLVVLSAASGEAAQQGAALNAKPAKAQASQVVAVRAGRPPVLDGAAVIHDLARIGGRYCFAGHVHYGSSSGQPSLAAAKSVAVQSWYELVNLEYGAQWSSYQISAAKNVACSQSGVTWGCEIHAIPCSR